MTKRNKILLSAYKKIFFTILLLLTFISSANCSNDITDNRNDIKIGYIFLNKCKSFDELYCRGFFIGALDAVKDAVLYNFGDNVELIFINLSHKEKHEIFIKYLKNNPEELNKTIYELIFQTFYKQKRLR